MLGPNLSFDKISRTAVCLSTMIIFSTIHAQDFPDIEGDSAEGRATLPIYAPELSRLLMMVLIPLWSAGLAIYWGIGQYCASIFVLFGFILGLRFYSWRNTSSDKRSYVLFNVRSCPVILIQTFLTYTFSIDLAFACGCLAFARTLWCFFNLNVSISLVLVVLTS